MANKTDYTKIIEGHRYIKYENAMRWLGLSTWIADREDFLEATLPAKYAFNDVKAAYIKWLIGVIDLKLVSLLQPDAMSEEGWDLLNKAEYCDEEDWFHLFRTNRTFFDIEETENPVKK